MTTTTLTRRLVELACLAPSVHNTQPWAWSAEAERIRLYADRSRQLPVEDPAGRSLTISCGAALHHLVFAAEALGWEAVVHRLPDAGDPDLLADVRLVRATPSPTAAEDLEVLRRRCTDRRRFTSWPVPDILLEALAEEARRQGAEAQAVVDVIARFRLELLAGRAQRIREADPVAAGEQSRWIDRPDGDGIPRAVLPSDGDETPTPRFGPGLVEENSTVVESGDGVIAIGGPDDPEGWLRTGEALSALWMRGTRDELSIVPLSLPIEVDEVRSELYGVVGSGTSVAHLLVRVGWQAIGRSDLPRTPRRPLDEVLRD
jgi:hypothetical protein